MKILFNRAMAIVLLLLFGRTLAHSVSSANRYALFTKNSTKVAIKTGSCAAYYNAMFQVSDSSIAKMEKAVVKATITSAANGNWENGSTWAGGSVPSSDDHVVIAPGHTVTITTSKTRNNGTTTVVAGMLVAKAHYADNGSTTINGAFQINIGGWGDGANFTYGSAGVLEFVASGNYDVTTAHSYWPAVNGPSTVTVHTGNVILIILVTGA